MDDNCLSACRASIMALRNASGDPTSTNPVVIKALQAESRSTYSPETILVALRPADQAHPRQGEKASFTPPGGAICRTPTDEPT